MAAGAGDRGHHSQQRPGQHVVDRGAGERDAADPGAMHASVGKDACQHRKCGDRRGRAREQREREDLMHVMTAGQPCAEPNPK